MICITINSESRRFALVDMFNAARQCDLLEMRLDKFGKAPELGEIIAKKPKPIIMSCRRVEDGGLWDGSEQERLAILRQCVVSKADYVELEMDVADEVRPYPGCKRVITYTNLHETPEDILDIYREAQSKRPDVIKLMTVARTPEEAWPLVQIVANPSTPTVVVGLGKPGVMLTVLGKKLNAPWAYAALEQGMEAYPGQPSVFDLNHVYRYEEIERSTRFVGVAGFGDREYVATSFLNSAFRHFKLPARVLPLGVGDTRLFRRILDAVKVAGVVVDHENQEALLEMATTVGPDAEVAGATDLLLKKNGGWSAHNTTVPAVVSILEQLIYERNPGESPLDKRLIAIAGANPLTRGVARALKAKGAAPILVSHDVKAVQQLAKELDCRYVKFEALYTTLHEVLIVCDHEKEHKPGSPSAIHPSYLRQGMVVMDLTAALSPSPLLREARARRCGAASPRRLLREQLAGQFRLLTGKELTAEQVEEVMPGFLQADEEELATEQG
jgi:3-dehydroquinate dehydratase/shikimate dehydrogenase